MAVRPAFASANPASHSSAIDVDTKASLSLDSRRTAAIAWAAAWKSAPRIAASVLTSPHG